MLVAYIRVSKKEQDHSRQEEELKDAGCDKIFSDKISGVKKERPGFNELMEFVRPGDTIVVIELSRLGRSFIDMVKTLEFLIEKDIKVKSLKEGIDSSTTMGKAMFRVAAIFAELEREYIIERTRSGLASKRARGIVGGRKRSTTKSEDAMIISLSKDTAVQISSILERFNISDRTYRRILKRGEQDESKTVES